MSSIHPIAENARGNPAVPTVVMLAAGMGSRVASVGNGRPKPDDSCARPVPCIERSW